MMFAAFEVNENPDLLPNITLALKIYNSCLFQKKAVEGVLSILTGMEKLIPNFLCQPLPTLLGIIGGGTSLNSIAMSSILDRYSVPEVSYAAVQDVLSDKAQFKSFLRTVPPMRPQSTAFALLVKHFGWTWIGLLSGDNDTCYMWSKDLKEDLKKVGVCLAFWEKVHEKYTKAKMRSIAESVRSSSARVIICDCFEMDLKPLLQELNDLNVTGRMWVFSARLTITPDYFPKLSLRLLNGSLVMVYHAPDMPGFKPFLESLHPSRFPGDIFIYSFWEEAFGCKWSNNGSSAGSGPVETKDGVMQCTGTEVLEDLESMFILSDMSYTYHSYLAVYALAQALQNLISCKPGMGPFQNSSCAEVEPPKLWQMLHYVKQVRFNTSSGEDIFFDKNGDVPAVFDFVNIKISSEGAIRLVKVVTYDSNDPEGKQIKIQDDAMMWNTRDNQFRHALEPSIVGLESLPEFSPVEAKVFMGDLGDKKVSRIYQTLVTHCSSSLLPLKEAWEKDVGPLDEDDWREALESPRGTAIAI
ncbi:vomeronasal type-2 receptor 1-like [Lissotriton helveticus]